MKSTLRLSALLLSLVFLSGCAADLNHLIFSTYTKVGLDISVAEGTPTEAVFGYKRFEGAVIPVDTNASDGTMAVHSVYAGLCVNNSWIKGLKLGQIFATGEAAENVAGNKTRSDVMKRILDCNGEQQQPDASSDSSGGGPS